ncbi:MAG TPA: hypothetical protein VG147_00470 [Solirubrobacteraceae bacterium]|jgi:hypothetical protein|nr:hypothetical protein [Solirubrobacteraceae bacterium]
MTTLLRTAALTLALSIGAALAPAAGAAPSEPAKPPANDEIANAQAIHSLPASIEGTTVGATTVPGEAQSSCVANTVSSVWYSLHTATAAERVAVELAAGGKLDGTIDVYKAVRSALQPVACQQTEEEGKASLTFKAQKNTEYEIRVAALANSQLAGFTLNVFQPTPSIAPPGPRLPSAGANGQVDRIQNSNAAYSIVMHAGVSYLVNLVNETKGGCVNGALFGPGTKSFEGASARFRVNCGGYRLFTPGQGKGGIYSFEVTPDPERKGEQRFHLQVTVANGMQITPGEELGNYGRSSGRLEGSGIQVLRLYRMDVTSHSNLTLRLSAPASAEFNLQLRDQNGGLIACSCSGSGSQKLQQQLRKGHYYAVVSERNHTSGNFTLTRESRTITHTKVAFGAEHGVAGQAVEIKVRVTPGAVGPVKVEVQRFDPVFGWQFYRTLEATVNEGTASIPFTPPSPGNWRANATYAGSRIFSPSHVGFTYLFV